MENKYYILATPCTGKTTYIKENKEKLKERNVYIYDMDDYYPKDYTIFDKLNTEDKNYLHIILGKMHNINYEKCNYYSVIIKEDTLREHCKKRKVKKPKKKWGDFNKTALVRNKLIDLTKKENIKSFETIEDAVNFIIEIFNKNKNKQ